MIPVYNIDYRNRLINKDGWRRFDEIVLMQSTGILDKNGVEIFEGDIIKTTDKNDDNYIGEVRCLVGAWRIDAGSRLIELWGDVCANEVLGSVYENPELLEGII